MGHFHPFLDSEHTSLVDNVQGVSVKCFDELIDVIIKYQL